VVRELLGALPLRGPCAPFLRVLIRLVLGVLVEVAVSAVREALD
jgi:hypothetical protein